MKKQSNNTHTERLTLRITKDLLYKIQERASARGMSVSAYVRACLYDVTILGNLLSKDAPKSKELLDAFNKLCITPIVGVDLAERQDETAVYDCKLKKDGE